MPTTYRLVQANLWGKSTYVTSDPALPGPQNYFVNNTPSVWSTVLATTRNKVPDYKSRIAKGVDASSPFSRMVAHWRPALYSGRCFRRKISASNPSWVANAIGSKTSYMSPEPYIASGDDTVLRDLALIRLKRKLQEESGKVNAAVPTAELRALRGMVTGTLPGIKKLVLDTSKLFVGLKRSSLGQKRGYTANQLAQVKADLSDVWLNFNFGIRPTLSDMEKTLAAIRDHFGGHERNVRLRGSASKRWVSGATTPGAPFLYGANAREDWSFDHHLRYQYDGAFALNVVVDASSYTLREHLGFELGALPSIGWELLPYSWALDYFANVGPWLDDEFVIMPGNLIYLTMSKKYFVSGVQTATPVPLTQYDTVSDFRCLNGSMMFMKFDRTVLTTLPHIGFRLKSLDEVGKNAIQKLANLVAVLKLDASDVTRSVREQRQRSRGQSRAIR